MTYVSDSDVFRMARLLFANKGVAAVAISAQFADEAVRSGDIYGANLWRRIVANLRELVIVK